MDYYNPVYRLLRTLRVIIIQFTEFYKLFVKPDLRLEKSLWRQGYQRVVGIDEVGRGALAGPVTVAGVLLQPGLGKIPPKLKEVRDSKKLTFRQREALYPPLTRAGCLSWAAASSSARVIDQVGIVKAIEQAIKQVVRKLSPVDFLILDGGLSISWPLEQRSLVKADEKIFSVAAASIIAKVRRDRWMVHYHSLYPVYNFKQHKGYGTREHRQVLEALGFCQIHRQTFKSSAPNEVQPPKLG